MSATPRLAAGEFGLSLTPYRSRGTRRKMLVSNGSQTADLSLGSMAAPAIIHFEGRSWALWKRLAHGRREFGNPEAFFGESRVSDTA